MLYQSTSWPRRMPSHNSSVGFCSYKSSIWKSKGKKGAENRVAVHLLRMQVKNTCLMTTWEEKTRRSDSTSENTTFGTTTYLFKVCANGSLHSCNPLCETRMIFDRATPCHGEHITEYSVPILRFGRRDNSSQPSFEIPRNLCGDAQDVRDMEISTPVMLCSWRATFSSKILAMGKWLHESFPMPEHRKHILVAVDTMCPNGLKHFLCCGRLKEFKEDGSGNHVSLLWISKSRV